MIEIILFPCPNCNGKHALCWLQCKSGRDLGVICSHVARKPKFVRLPQNKIDQMDESELDKIPVHYTPEGSKKEADKGQTGMNLMYIQPGEQVERTIELPRNQESDDQAAIRLNQEINQRIQAKREINSEIKKLVDAREELEKEKIALRHKLREVWTEPLDFTP